MYEIEGPHSHGVATMRVTIAVGSGSSIAFVDLSRELPRALARSSF